MTARRYDMDWLRIGAFALLILYHIGMVFVPWGFHIKTAEPLRWVEAPMLLLNAWRLSLLFLISGIASRMMLARRPGFATERSRRLLVPLLFGMAFIVPPQSWAEVVTQGAYTKGFLVFWSSDYWTFGNFVTPNAEDLILPTWNHLWFIAYLWVYSMLLALLLAAARRSAVDWQAGFDRLFGGWRLLVLPILWVFAAKMLLMARWPESHALAGDWYAHALYGFAFAFGVGLGGSTRLWAGFDRFAVPSGIVALIAWAITATVVLNMPENTDWPAWLQTAIRGTRAVQGWLAIVALVGLARRWLNFDHPWRAPLNAAVFPAYIVHQTIIVMVMFWLLPLQLPALAEFAILVAVTTLGCALAYLLARRSAWLGPLLGVPGRTGARAPSCASSQALRSTPPA
jgi:hypothetical protein